MSLQNRLRKLEEAAYKRLDYEDYTAPGSIRRFQELGFDTELWPWMLRQYAISYKIPVFGRILTEKDAVWPTNALRKYYRTHRRLPWNREETDHPATFGPWEEFCRRYDSGAYAEEEPSKSNKHGESHAAARRKSNCCGT